MYVRTGGSGQKLVASRELFAHLNKQHGSASEALALCRAPRDGRGRDGEHVLTPV